MLTKLRTCLLAIICVAAALQLCGCGGPADSAVSSEDSVVSQQTSTEDIGDDLIQHTSSAAQTDDTDSVIIETIPDDTSSSAVTEEITTADDTVILDEPVLTETVLSAQQLSQYSVGRTLLSNDVLYMNHSCSGIRFDFKGSYLSAELVSSSEYCYDEIHRAWVAVYIGDSTEPYTRFPLDSERAQYTLIDSDQPINDRVTVIKLTEQQFGTAGIVSLETGRGDSLSPVQPTAGYIEFFGDSITAGYGNEGELSHGFDTTEENGYLTYAPITAREFGVDYSMVCVSGMGLTASRTCDYVAADIYPKTDVFLSDEQYDFERAPQLIVVNLGANDSYYINTDSSYYEVFEQRYYELLTMIRQKNPDAVILCCICDFWKARMPQIDRVIDNYCADTGDSNVHSLLLPYVRNDADYGSDAHPKISVQYEIAEVLIEKIRELDIF